jgi:hypothetical protein
MRRTTRTLTLAAAAGLAAVTIGAVAMQEAGPVQGSGASVAWSGAASAVEDEGCVLVRTTEEWVDTWSRHLGQELKRPYDFYFNRAGVPEVDFGTQMVLAVFAGNTSNTAGYACKSVETRDGAVVITVSSKSYQTMDESRHATPFGIFVVPRTEQRVLVDEFQGSMGGGGGRTMRLAEFPAAGG